MNRISTSPHFPPPPFTPPNFSSFTCVTTDEVFKLLSQSPDTNYDLDPIPTFLLKQCSHILLPITTIHLPSNVMLSPVDSARNLGVIFDENLSFAQHISSISKPCFLNIRDLRRIRNIDQLLHAPLLLLSFILKLPVVTLFY